MMLKNLLRRPFRCFCTKTTGKKIYNITAPRYNMNELRKIMSYYEYDHRIKECNTNLSICVQTSSNQKKAYKTIEEFLQRDIFYQNKKNHYHLPLANHGNNVINFKISPIDIIRTNSITSPLLSDRFFANCLANVHNYGTFVRFSENKVQRLYWNPPFNGGLPLTPKPKDATYEMIFCLHSICHFLLPDLVFTGKLIDEKAKKIYVYHRLLSESMTVVISEMLAVDILKDTDEFKSKLKMDYDHPYKLYSCILGTNEMNQHSLKQLFWASYMYFCQHNYDEFNKLFDHNEENKKIWDNFHFRYSSVSLRGKDWTEKNFDNMTKEHNLYQSWWKSVEQYKNELQLVPIEDYYDKVTNDDNDIMHKLFNNVWNNVILGILCQKDRIYPICEEERQILAFKRYMIGNTLLLFKHQIYPFYLLSELQNMVDITQMEKITNIYISHVNDLYNCNKIDINEYHNYKNIYYMIPPNMLKKSEY